MVVILNNRDKLIVSLQDTVRTMDFWGRGH